MPARNSVKVYAPDLYYHVYNRGANKQKIFKTDRDYKVFLAKLKKLLADKAYASYCGNDVELTAFCLMPNHFHLLLKNTSPNGIEKLMRSLMTSYAMYFNKAHRHSGTIFQGVYKASHISDDEYFTHVTRYIHLNPHYNNRHYSQYAYSSFQYYMGSLRADWVNPELFEFTNESYREFCDEYLAKKDELDIIKHMLANQTDI